MLQGVFNSATVIHLSEVEDGKDGEDTVDDEGMAHQYPHRKER